MDIQEKKDELNKLKKITYPSEHELFKIAELEDDINLMMEEEQNKTSNQNTEPIQEEPKPQAKRKRTLIEYAVDKIRERQGKQVKERPQTPDIFSKILSKFEKKPATWDEINQLKLEVIKERLKKDVAISKDKQRELRNKRLSSILGSIGLKNENPSTKKRSKSHSSKDNDSADDIRSILGTNDASRYKDLIG